ncbi:MAG: nitrile hydratase accessory protein [Deltaproteobacteria bacterium]|nr:nitrile hydratase accessory protein [Deltaproteobacteria bacterium]
MPRATNPDIAEMTGPASLPRSSGELVFHDAWERRAFALAVFLCEQGYYQWDEFRDHLIAEIAAAEKAVGPHAASDSLPSYYESWLAALEKLLAKKGIPPS